MLDLLAVLSGLSVARIGLWCGLTLMTPTLVGSLWHDLWCDLGLSVTPCCGMVCLGLSVTPCCGMVWSGVVCPSMLWYGAALPICMRCRTSTHLVAVTL